MVVNTKQIREKTFSKGIPDFVVKKALPIIEKTIEKWEIGITDNVQNPRLFSYESSQYNAIYGNYYKGSNIFMLSLWKHAYDYTHDGWIPSGKSTSKLYKSSLNDDPIKIKTGTRAVPVIFSEQRFTDKGKKILVQNNLKPLIKVWEVKNNYPEIWKLVKNETFYYERWWNLFNVENFDNLLGTENEKILKTPKNHKESIENKETLKLDTKNDEKFIDDITINMDNKPKIKFGLHRVSNYRPYDDLISIRPSNEMLDFEFFYETLVHELVHSTGHADRTERHKKKLNFASGHNERSTEELVAELGMFMSLDRVNDKDLDKKLIHNNVGQYLKSWLSQDNTPKKKVEKLMVASELADQGERYIFDPK
jgi:hypothetical protein